MQFDNGYSSWESLQPIEVCIKETKLEILIVYRIIFIIFDHKDMNFLTKLKEQATKLT